MIFSNSAVRETPNHAYWNLKSLMNVDGAGQLPGGNLYVLFSQRGNHVGRGKPASRQAHRSSHTRMAYLRSPKIMTSPRRVRA